MVYEGFAPGGTAVIVDALTDNKNRTVSEVRNLFNKGGGNLGNSGCVAFMFETRGRILIPVDKIGEDDLMMKALEAGADDVEPPEDSTPEEPGFWTVLTTPANFMLVKDTLTTAGIPVEEAEIAKIPGDQVEVRGDDARKLMNLIDALEDNEDVQKVHTNASIPDDELSELG